LASPAWGMKRTCQSCGTRFYDLNHSTIACPKCGTVYDPESGARTRRGRSAAAKVAAPRPIPVPAAEVPEEVAEVPVADEELAAEVEEADEEEELIEDTSELGEDEDDMAEVIENVEGEEER
jgi:uncharacterized protein (TIGR02300 family)